MRFTFHLFVFTQRCIVHGMYIFNELLAFLIMCLPASATADSAVVDIFNVTANTWSTAVLSIARQYLAATSLPDHGIAFVAGGYSAFFVI